MDTTDYKKILRNWHVKFAVAEEAAEPKKNPLPVVITDADGSKWILESLSKEDYSRKLTIAETLEQIKKNGCSFIHPYQRNSLGQFTTFYGGQLCMLRPYIEGIPVQKDSWLSEGWRVDAMADFIISMRQASKRSVIHGDSKSLTIIDFVKQRTEALNRHRPEISEGLTSVFQNLETNLFPIINSLPTAFCHGNYTPMDMVWGESSIKSVGGWDYCGIKQEAYDAALFVGYIGFDMPDMLISDSTTRFISKLQEAALFSEQTWDIFFDLLITTRYGWLSKWMRTNNEKNRDLEMLYMNLLNTQRSYILKKWNLPN
jgi:homoserine kinase type II